MDGCSELVRAAQRGDRRAFHALYDRFRRYVHALILARVELADAADVSQEIFLHAWTHLRTLRDVESFPGWLGTLARHRATDHARRAPRLVTLEDRFTAPDHPELTAEAASVLRVIRELPEAYSETLTLRLVEGYSGPEIAALTGRTPDSVRVNLHRGFKLLRERLGVET
jgi:RNA polymerase sigma-70 factor (ECF subfamily)